MKIRLGYACISETLQKVTSSTNYTYTEYVKKQDKNKLDRIIRSNLFCLEQILLYNIRNHIHFYRLSSGIIPLATKKEVVFDYTSPYQDSYKRIGNLIRKNNLRVDFHPSEFCVLNSTRKEVIENSIVILEYHYKLLESFQIKNKIMVLHIGSSACGKKASLSRFIHTFEQLPIYLQQAIAIENDDKIYTISDCLELSEKIHVPVVLDYHHHLCNPSEINYQKIVDTWEGKGIIPKMHFSSPKSKLKKEFRSHHDYIDCDKFILFLQEISDLGVDIDIMIEAKKKDEAMFRLIRELKYKTNYVFLDETTIKIN